MNVQTEQDNRVIDSNKLDGKIEVNRLSFRYRSNLPPALLNVSFNVEPGEVVCVVGKNGAGKSTLLKMILKLYVPQMGGIWIDNRDIKQQDAIVFAP